MSLATILRPDNVNYEPVVEHTGQYRFLRLQPSNITGTSVDLDGSATSMIEYELPANTVFNLSKTVLDYQISIPVQNPAKVAVWAFEDTFEIAQAVQYGLAADNLLVDLQFANNYVSAARKIDTDKEDFEVADATEGLYSNKINLASDANYFPPTVTFLASAAPVYGQDAAGATFKRGISQVEPRYARALDATATNVLTRSVPLKAVTKTLLSQDKDVLFPVATTLRFMIASSNKIGYTGGSLTDPTTTPAAFNVQPKVQNLVLRLAIQKDEATAAVVKALYARNELQFVYPFTYAWKQVTLAGEPSIQLKFTAQWGKRLQRILHVPFGNSETVNLAYDHENIDGAKISQYQTFLDSKPLQDAVLSCKQPTATAHNMDDYRENRKHIKGSVLENGAVYGYNWFHIDSFTNPDRSRKAIVPEGNIVEGLALTSEYTPIWISQQTAAVNLTQYVFGTFLREVKLCPEGIISL